MNPNLIWQAYVSDGIRGWMLSNPVCRHKGNRKRQMIKQKCQFASGCSRFQYGRAVPIAYLPSPPESSAAEYKQQLPTNP